MTLGSRFGTQLTVVLIIGHLALLAVAAIPNPEALPAAETLRASPDDAVSSRVRPVLDAMASGLRVAVKQAWYLTTFVRPVAHAYVRRLGLAQTWNMFGSPPTRSEYLRLRYFWKHGPGDGAPMMTATEMVFPKVFESQAHLVAAYLDGNRDKAVSNAFGAYFEDRKRLNVTGPSLEDLQKAHVDSLKPVTEFFSSQYAAKHLGPEDHFVRVEVWYGWAASRARGDVLTSPQSRAAAIQRAYNGLPPHPAGDTPFVRIDTVERDADVQWVLTWVKTP